MGHGELAWYWAGMDWAGGVRHRYAAARLVLSPGKRFSAGVEYAYLPLCCRHSWLAIVVTQTGIGTAVGEALLRIMPLDADKPFTSFLALTGITTALNFIMTANGVPALYTTLAQSFSDATGSAAVGDYDSGTGLFHAAAAVSGVADCCGDGAREGACKAG